MFPWPHGRKLIFLRFSGSGTKLRVDNMVSTVLITCTLVLWPFYRHCTSFIYIMMMYVFHLYLTCVVSFLSLYTCFLVYITCLYFTLDALMDLVWVFQLRQVVVFHVMISLLAKIFKNSLLIGQECIDSFGNLIN